MKRNDHCDKEGAIRLKRRIEEYWADRGFEVKVHLQDADFVSAMRSRRVDVRSDMVNGLPKGVADGDV